MLLGLKIKPILGFEDLKSTKHNQQTYSRDRWKEMAETIRQMREEEPCSPLLG